MSAAKDTVLPADRPEEGRSPEEHREKAMRPQQSKTACEICGGAVEEVHCKIVCLNCGYQRDCSDP